MAPKDPYTPEIAAEICRRLREGESLRSICRDPLMPDRSTVYTWVQDDREGFADQYTRAKEIGLDVMSEELFDIADDGSNDWMEREGKDGAPLVVVNGEHINRSRLRVDTRKWYLSKLAPKRFGDRTAVEVSGSLNLQTALASATLEELEQLRAKLAAEHDAGLDLA